MTLPMKPIICLLLAAGSLLAVPATPDLPLVPKPQSVTQLGGSPSTLDGKTRILYDGEGAGEIARLLADVLRTNTKLPLPVSALKGAKLENTISLIVSPRAQDKNPESYAIKSQNGQTRILAPSSRGLFNGTRTLIQLVPLDKPTIPAVLIADAPSYTWRGMMLDVSRYFFTKEYVLRYLDMMAMHKMNTLHWHLVDDAGWRIEIKKYPKLTEIGAWRGKGDKRYGGFYTRDDIREIVAYAAARNITIVPEIELPAHTLPALVAYPQLGCFGKQFTVPTRHSISPELYCAGKESTWKFLEDVFTEVCDLFPGTFIHIGGDEARFSRWEKCPDCQKKMKALHLKSEHELQGWMTTRIEKFLKTKGKRIIGWDEILGAGVSSKAGIMTWRRPKTAVQGAQRGNPVVMSLTAHAYFDTAESRLPGEPPTAGWIPPVSLRKAYEWTPTPNGLTGDASQNILGASGCIWSDQFLHKAQILADKPGEGTTASEAYIDYLSLPRMAALAEVTWTSAKIRKQGGFGDFTRRMRPIYARYTKRGYQFRVPVPEISIKENQDKTHTLSATPAITGGIIRYSLDATTPTTDSMVLDGSVTVTTLPDFRAATFLPGNQRHSLLYRYIDKSNKYARYGEEIGNWKSEQVANQKPREFIFDATGRINANGDYTISFVHSKGADRLELSGIEVVRNDLVPVANDKHKGFAGKRSRGNSYHIHVGNYETGASFKIKAMLHTQKGQDTNGLVLIRRGK